MYHEIGATYEKVKAVLFRAASETQGKFGSKLSWSILDTVRSMTGDLMWDTVKRILKGLKCNVNTQNDAIFVIARSYFAHWLPNEGKVFLAGRTIKTMGKLRDA